MLQQCMNNYETQECLPLTGAANIINLVVAQNLVKFKFLLATINRYCCITMI